jgi:hypothetical protein
VSLYGAICLCSCCLSVIAISQGATLLGCECDRLGPTAALWRGDPHISRRLSNVVFAVDNHENVGLVMSILET